MWRVPTKPAWATVRGGRSVARRRGGLQPEAVGSSGGGRSQPLGGMEAPQAKGQEAPAKLPTWVPEDELAGQC